MLVNTTPARDSVAVLARELSVAAADGRLAAYLDQPVRLDTLSVTAPHPVFVLDIDDLSDGDLDPRGASFAGWRYLLEVNHRVVALATTTVDADGVHRFGGIGTGPAVVSMVYAVHLADQLLQTAPEDFHIIAIDVPALHIFLLQVSSNESSAFLPVGLATSLHPARLHSRADVRRELRRMASEVVEMPVADEPVGG